MKKYIFAGLFFWLLTNFSKADVPEYYYYLYVNESSNNNIDNYLPEGKGLTYETDPVTWTKTISWFSYSFLKVKYDDSENSLFYTGDFPATLNWNTYETNINDALAMWEWSPSPATFDIDNNEESDNSIMIYFTDDEIPASKSHIAGQGLPAAEAVTYYIVYNDDGNFAKYNNETITQTRIRLNGSTHFFNHLIIDPHNPDNSHKQEWTQSEPIEYYQWYLPFVLQHEMGHILGLAHPQGTEWSGAVMIGGGIGKKREVTNLDLIALENLYNGYIPDPNPGGLIDETSPKFFSISANYPNPFNSSTIIEYFLPEKMDVEISIYNLSGRKVRTLFKGSKEDGLHKISWDSRNSNYISVTSEIYFVTIRSSKVIKSKKLLLLR